MSFPGLSPCSFLGFALSFFLSFFLALSFVPSPLSSTVPPLVSCFLLCCPRSFPSSISIPLGSSFVLFFFLYVRLHSFLSLHPSPARRLTNKTKDDKKEMIQTTYPVDSVFSLAQSEDGGGRFVRLRPSKKHQPKLGLGAPFARPPRPLRGVGARQKPRQRPHGENTSFVQYRQVVFRCTVLASTG